MVETMSSGRVRFSPPAICSDRDGNSSPGLSLLVMVSPYLCAGLATSDCHKLLDVNTASQEILLTKHCVYKRLECLELAAAIYELNRTHMNHTLRFR